MSTKIVWLVNHYAQEPGSSGGTRHFELARELRRHGWDAWVIAASTQLNTKLQRLRAGETSRVETFEGVPFLWLRAPVHQGNGIGRIRNMAAFSLRLLRRSTRRQLPRPTVIVGSTVHPLAAWAASRVARSLRIPFIFEVRDLWPETLIDLQRMRRDGLQARLLYRLESHLCRRAHDVITLLPQSIAYFESKGVPREHIHWIPNGVRIGPLAEDVRALDRAFTFMYFGAHGTANGLDCLLDAMRGIAATPMASSIQLRLVGDGPTKPALVAKARALGLTSVSFEDPVPKSRIPSLAAEADAFVFNLVDAGVFKYGISSNKLFDYLAAARPTVFCCNSPENPVEASRGGVTVPAGDAAALADAMIRLSMLPPDERRAMGERARAWVIEHHDFQRLGARLASVLDAACGLEAREVQHGRPLRSA